MASIILKELEFCRQQVLKYTTMYEDLLSQYRIISGICNGRTKSEKPHRRQKQKQKQKQKKSAPADPESESENELTSSIVNFINSDADKELHVNVKATAKKFERDTFAETDDGGIPMEEFTNLFNDKADQDRKNIQESTKLDEADFKRIEKKKYDAREGIKKHEELLTKIYNEEKRLLDLGLDKETVRKRVREEFYPEAIPASERKTPKIYVDARDEKGRPIKKSVSILAFDENYLEDDDPELTAAIAARHEENSERVLETLDLPDIEEEAPNDALEDALAKFLAQDDSGSDDDVVEEIAL
jgi:hypothetical protein